MKRDTRIAWMMLTPFLLCFCAFVLYPVILNLYYSFTNYNLATAPDFVGLRNFTRLPKDAAFVKSLKNTAWYALNSIISLTTLGFFTAAALNRRFFGEKALRTLVIFPYATSMTAVSMIWLMMFDPLNGFLNKLLIAFGAPGGMWLFDANVALNCLIFVNVWKNLGYCMLIYLAGMQSIDPAIIEAAKVDGASDFTRLMRITLPAIRPVAFFVLITTTVEAFKTFEQVLIMTRGDPLNATTTIVHQIYLRGFNEFKMGYAASMAVVLLVIMMILTLIQFALGARGGEDA